MNCPLFLSLLLLGLHTVGPQNGTGASGSAGSAVWIEGENPTSTNLKPLVAGWGHKEFLSGEKWLQVSIDAEHVDRDLPVGGGLLTYDFTVAQGGPQEIWDRIGYEGVRSAFEWRIDGESWNRISPESRTTDMQELDTWCEVAWLKLGEKPLTTGAHTLQIRLPRTTDGKGQVQRVLYASDALLISPERFRPNGKYRPGEDFQTDQDRAAGAKVFAVSSTAGPERQTVPLGGLWEIARDDEDLPGPVAEPISELPTDPKWYGIPVPSDKHVARPELTMAHRVWYRTRLSVPSSQVGRSFFLTFPQNNLNTTVYVNGTLCGFNKNPFVNWTCDVTPGIHAGVNELWVGIRDAWYGYASNPKDPLKLRSSFVIPLSMTGTGFQNFAYPEWNGMESGILDTPRLSVGGAVAVSDVFVKPSVARKALDGEVTLLNTTAEAARGEVMVSAVDDATGKVAKVFPAAQFSIDGHQSKLLNVGGPWADPVLWWPDRPHLYRLKVSLRLDGARAGLRGGVAVDETETTFGFREWSTRGRDFLLNGIVWHGWAELTQGHDRAEWLKNYRKTGQRFMRLCAPSMNGGVNWYDLSYEGALNFFDRNGVVVRRCGPLDGEAIGYFAIETDPDLKALYGTEIKKQLLDNWRDQMAAQVKGERNHPSIGIWSIENEWLYINCINLYGGLMDDFEREELATIRAVQAVDPTRPVMADGGGAGRQNRFPVAGDHYVYTGDPSSYPDLAYEPFTTGAGRGRWEWDMKRPRFIGEDYFASGINAADYAWIQGEEAFGGKVAATTGYGLVQRMLTEGYRWGGYYGAWHFWVGDEGAQAGKYIPNAERAVLVRQQDWTFGSGSLVTRTLGVFNDSRYSDPLTLSYSVVIGGRVMSTATKKCLVPPGGSEKFNVALKMPFVAERVAGEFEMSLKVGGKIVFADRKPLAVLPFPHFGASGLWGTGDHSARWGVASRHSFKAGVHPTLPSPPAERAPTPKLGRLIVAPLDVPREESVVAAYKSRTGNLMGQPRFSVFDPAHSVDGKLLLAGVSFSRITSLDDLPAQCDVLVIGPDALSESESTRSRLAAYAADGHRVVVLSQEHPLKYQGLPFELQSTTDRGSFAFPEDPSHPVFMGLKSEDFRGWAHGVYANAYMKPTKGATSLLQVGPRLSETAIVEMPVGQGLLLLCEVAPDHEPVSDLLTLNLIAYASTYRLAYRPVVAVSSDPLLNHAMDRIGLKFARAGDAVGALIPPGQRIAVISATPENLHRLAGSLPTMRAFTDRGGEIVFHGLTPEGLADYNKIVGFGHVIRPFRREKTAFTIPRNPLTTGLSQGDIVQSSSEHMFGFNNDMFASSDEFSFAVDYDDIAPFAKLPDDYSYNIVNGFVSADSWKYIYSFDLDHQKPEMQMDFPKPEEFTEITWIGNAFYHKVKRFALVFDGGQTVTFNPEPNDKPQVFAIDPPRRASHVTVKLLEWTQNDATANVVGIDNISLKVKRPAEFYGRVKPLLNVGALMQYKFGAGGIVLANIKFEEREDVPENVDKKLAMLSAILRNLKAPFASGRLVVAGDHHLQFQPIDISKQANQYRNSQGWFGDRAATFADLPTGRQVFDSVPFEVYDFPTSPVPNAVMLGGGGIPGNLPSAVRGIAVGMKASALFFLQAARIDQRRNRDEIRDNREFEVAHYVVHYADGQVVNVPIREEIDVEEYRQDSPVSIAGAQIAWTKRFAESKGSAVAYMMQWNNPRPEVEISSIDLEYGAEHRGVPALLAVTAAKP